MEVHGNGRAKELANLLFGIQETAQPQQSERKGSDSTSDSARADTVSISREGRTIQRLADLVKAAEPASAGRVAEVRDAIANGTYQVDGRTAGDALIRDVLIESVL